MIAHGQFGSAQIMYGLQERPNRDDACMFEGHPLVAMDLGAWAGPGPGVLSERIAAWVVPSVGRRSPKYRLSRVQQGEARNSRCMVAPET